MKKRRRKLAAPPPPESSQGPVKRMASEEFDHVEAAEEIIARLGAEDIPRLEEALAQRRRELALDEHPSTVLERRPCADGELIYAWRSFTRKDGTKKWRGPYWYFHYRDGARQKTLYLGKTDNPEGKLAEKRAES